MVEACSAREWCFRCGICLVVLRVCEARRNKWRVRRARASPKPVRKHARREAAGHDRFLSLSIRRQVLPARASRVHQAVNGEPSPMISDQISADSTTAPSLHGAVQLHAAVEGEVAVRIKADSTSSAARAAMEAAPECDRFGDRTRIHEEDGVVPTVGAFKRRTLREGGREPLLLVRPANLPPSEQGKQIHLGRGIRAAPAAAALSHMEAIDLEYEHL
jgi:hypothetical protein